MRFTEEDYEQFKGQRIRGRIAEYNKRNGYGHIYAENRKDVFLSSYALNDLEKVIAIGSIISFIPEKFEDKICATDVQIESVFPSGRTLRLPNNENIFIKYIQKFGIVSGESAVKELGSRAVIDETHKIEDYSYLYFLVKKKIGENNFEIKEYRFYNKNVDLEGDGKTDVERTFSYLCKRFLYLDDFKK